MDFTGLNFILSCMILLAAGFSFWYGHETGVSVGIHGTVDLMVEDGLLSRFVTEDGDLDICAAGVMNNICPKCGFHEGDNCVEHS